MYIFIFGLWFVICILCGVTFAYIDLNNADAAYNFFSNYCGSKNFIKQSMCLNEFFTTGYNSLSLAFTDRMWAIPVGDGYFVYYQTLEPTIGIPFAAYWTPILGLYMLENIFEYYNDFSWDLRFDNKNEVGDSPDNRSHENKVSSRAQENMQAIDSTSKVVFLSEKMRSDSELNQEPQKGYSFNTISEGVLGLVLLALGILSIICFVCLFAEFIFLLQGKATPIYTPSDSPKDILDNRRIGWFIIAFAWLVYSVIVPKISWYSSAKTLNLVIYFTKQIWICSLILLIPFLLYTTAGGTPLEDMKGIYILTDGENMMGTLMILILLRVIIEIIDWLVSGTSFFKVVNLFWCMIFLFFIPPWLDNLRALFNKELRDYNAVNYPGADKFQFYAFIIMLVLGLIIYLSQIVLNERSKTK